MPCVSRRQNSRALPAYLAALLSLATFTANAAPDAGTTQAAPAAPQAVPVARVDAAGGVGWARDASAAEWRALTEARAELGYFGTRGMVLGLRGLYQASERSYVTTGPVNLSAGGTRVVERERRVDVGAWLGWDPLHTWPDPRNHRAGFTLVVMALDLDQQMNRLAPIVGFEPGGGLKSYVHVAGPLVLRAGGTYQWVTNFSPPASSARVVRGMPLGTLRYDAALGVELFRVATLEARYAGESFTFLHDSTLTHAVLAGIVLDV
jgi:hypothetical protein